MKAIGCLTIFGVVGFCYAARPFATDDAGTVAPGGFELEAGADYWEDDLGLTLGFKHGLTDKMDIGVGLEYVVKPDQPEGFGPAGISFKYALVPDLFAASVAGEFGGVEYDLNGILSRCFGPLEVDLNFGYAASGVNSTAGSVTYGGAFIFGVGKIDAGVETGGDKDGLQVWQCGARFAIMDGLAVDCGFSGGFEDDGGNTAATGLHYEF